jgi:hypothetical protein
MPDRSELIQRIGSKEIQAGLAEPFEPMTKPLFEKNPVLEGGVREGPKLGASQDDKKREKLLARIRAKELRAGLGQREDVTLGGAVTRGILEGATLSLGGDIAAGAQAFAETLSGTKLGGRGDLESTFLERFKELRRKGKMQQAAEREAYPTATTAAEIGGAIGTGILAPTTLAPKVARGIGKLVPSISPKAAGLVGEGITAMGTAGVVGLGESQSDTLVGAFEDAAKAMPLGLVGMGVSKGIGAAIPGMKSLGTKALRTVTRVPEKHLKRYVKRASEINNVPEIGELSNRIVDDVERLRDRVIKGSQNATDLIPSGVRFSREEIYAPFKEMINKLRARRTDEHSLVAKELDRFISRGSQTPEVSGTELKEILKDLSLSIKSKDVRGVFNPVAGSSKLQIYNQINAMLREQAPEYAEAMVDVAADRNALGLLMQTGNKPIFPPSDKITGRRIERAGREGFGKEYEALKALDSRLGTTYSDTAQDLITKSSLQSEKTRGSRNVNLWGILGMAMSGSPGAAVGAASGAAIDMFGGQMAKGVLDAYRARTAVQGSRIGKLLAKFGPTLEKAGSPQGLAATNAFLFENDPEYRYLIDNLTTANLQPGGPGYTIDRNGAKDVFKKTNDLDVSRQGGLGSLINQPETKLVIER